MAGRLEQLLARQEYRLFVAQAEQQVVGFAGVYLAHALEFDATYGRLIGLAVDESFRGQGIGRMLLERIEDWLGEQQAAMLVITSGLHRKQAHRFYQALGYRKTGLRFMKQIGTTSAPTERVG
jgi:ribosomal protein S18 acetylase RimI-like enzyme